MVVCVFVQIRLLLSNILKHDMHYFRINPFHTNHCYSLCVRMKINQDITCISFQHVAILSASKNIVLQKATIIGGSLYCLSCVPCVV